MTKFIFVLMTVLWCAAPTCSMFAADSLPGLIRERTEGPEMLCMLSYLTLPKKENGAIVDSKQERRTLSVMRERLGWNRSPIRDEFDRFCSKFTSDGTIVSLEHNTF